MVLRCKIPHNEQETVIAKSIEISEALRAPKVKREEKKTAARATKEPHPRLRHSGLEFL
jgi:hypothetical protein